ncbi:MAG: hypothetical protein WAO95_14165 [Burkholderiales bacterium]
MQELLNNPAVQGVVAPFAVALVVVFGLFLLRQGGLAIGAALGTAVYLVGGAAFPPVSAQQKILLVSLVVPVVGIIVDLAFKPTRAAAAVLGLIFGLAALWVGVNVLKQKELPAMLLTGGGVAALVGWLVAAMFALRDDPLRAGAAALALGLGVGVSALLSASGSYGQYGASVGAGAGAFLLAQMLMGRTIAAGATLALSAGVACGLIAVGAVLGSPLPWYAAAALALVPLAVRVPLPKAGIRIQAIAASVYGGIPALAACLLSWPQMQQRLGF